MGAEPNFFDTPGAQTHAFPLYSVDDAERLRSRLLTVFEQAHRNPALIEKGALNFVIVGAGATGVETAGALADTINRLIPARVADAKVDLAAIYLVDPAPVVLAPFSERAHNVRQGGAWSSEACGSSWAPRSPRSGSDGVVLSDGREILTRTVVWAGGIKAARLAGASGLPQAPSGRLEIGPDLSVAGFPGVYALGDVANTLGPDGEPFPQLGSVALQAGTCAAKNIVAEIDGESTKPFRYRDKGIMAMIGRNAAIAEVGPRRRELHGVVAYASWLGVHAWLLSGFRTRVGALGAWGWDYVAKTRAAAYINRPDAAQIDWDE